MRGFISSGSGGAGLKITRLFCWLYGSHLSIKTDCGLFGIGANRSIITFLGGGGNLRPCIDTYLQPIIGGGFGGCSRIIKGSGVTGLGGCWRIIIGGAGIVSLFASCFIIISPGVGGVGGLK